MLLIYLATSETSRYVLSKVWHTQLQSIDQLRTWFSINNRRDSLLSLGKLEMCIVAENAMRSENKKQNQFQE